MDAAGDIAGTAELISCEAWVPAAHPLRTVRAAADEILTIHTHAAEPAEAALLGHFTAGPLLRALLLKRLFAIESEQHLLEQVRYNLLFRWFVGLPFGAAVWDAPAFREGAQPLQRAGLVANFLAAVLSSRQVREANELAYAALSDDNRRASNLRAGDTAAPSGPPPLADATALADALRARAEMQIILSTISDGIVTLDRDFRLRYVNAAALATFRCGEAEALGALLWDLLPDSQHGAVGQNLELAMRARRATDFVAHYPARDAWLDMRAYPAGSGLTVCFRDVTLQRETEDRLRQTQRLEAIGQLTGGIAHDVNNLLTVILGSFETLDLVAEQSGAADPFTQELVRSGTRAAESASEMIHRLLAFARRQPLSPVVVDVAGLLQRMEPMLRRTLGEAVQLRLQAFHAAGCAVVDPTELDNALLNLVINAKDAMEDMPGGMGTVSIGAEEVELTQGEADAERTGAVGHFVRLTVSDNGSGMSRDVLERAFDPFFTTKEPGKGTGLGLSMVYGFARQSGGHVLIDSAPGRGTEVRIYLPRMLEEPEERPAREIDVAPPGTERILLVEDNQMVREHTEALLASLGYQVLAVPDGHEAIRWLRDGLRPDLLLTDVILPGTLTGRDVADEAQRLLPGIRILFTSGYTGNVLLTRGRLQPGVDLLRKPYRRTDLAERIRAQLDRPVRE